MSDQAIQNAISKRVELESRIVKAEDVIRRSKLQIAEINRFIKQWEKFSGRSTDDVSTSKSLENNVNVHNYQSGDVSARATNNPRKEEVAAEVVKILSDTEFPMSRTDLYKALLARGVTINGSNPEMVLSTMLWRTRDVFGITRLKSGGYCLASCAAPDDIDYSDRDISDDNEE
jgi:hypothetical protein